MRVNKLLFCVLILGLLAFSCTKKLTADEYKVYVSDPENGLRKDEIVDAFELSAMYEPAEYLLAQNRTNLSLEDYQAFEHFQFRIKLVQGGDILLYQETANQNEVTRINHFGFAAQGDFKIYTDQDTVDCKMVHYSRNYNLSPTVDLSLVFDPVPKNSDWQLVYHDKQFNIGKVKFLFKSTDLNNLPELKLEK